MAQAGWIKKRLGVVVVALLIVVCGANHAAAQEDTDQWQFGLSLYAWLPEIDGTVNHTGNPAMPEGPFKIDTSDILDSLKMVFMGGFEASKNKWSIITDVIYLDMGNDKTATVTTRGGRQLSAHVDLELSAWVVGGAVGYEVLQDDWGTLSVVGGLRYTSIDVDSTLTLNLLQQRSSTFSGSDDLLDGIVGIRGFINLTEHWYLPYYGDIGAGGSDLTWQLLGGIGYRFKWGDIKFAYRYLDYELDDGKTLEDLTVDGFLLGVTFRF